MQLYYIKTCVNSDGLIGGIQFAIATDSYLNTTVKKYILQPIG